jgi:hypothetical protein
MLSFATCWAAMEVLAADTLQAAGSQAPSRPMEGAECAICFDELTGGTSTAERAVDTCESCGNHLHKEVCSIATLVSMHWQLPLTHLHANTTHPDGMVTCFLCHSALQSGQRQRRAMSPAHTAAAHGPCPRVLLQQAPARWVVT